MVYIIHKVIPIFSRDASVRKDRRNLRKGAKVEVFPGLNASIPTWLVRHCSFWFCNWCFNIEKEIPLSYASLCPRCRRSMKLCSLKWGSKIRVYHTKYIVNRKTGEVYKRRNGKKICTPLKKIFDGRLFLFKDHIVSKIDEWKAVKEKKT